MGQTKDQSATNDCWDKTQAGAKRAIYQPAEGKFLPDWDDHGGDDDDRDELGGVDGADDVADGLIVSTGGGLAAAEQRHEQDLGGGSGDHNERGLPQDMPHRMLRAAPPDDGPALPERPHDVQPHAQQCTDGGEHAEDEEIDDERGALAEDASGNHAPDCGEPDGGEHPRQDRGDRPDGAPPR